MSINKFIFRSALLGFLLLLIPIRANAEGYQTEDTGAVSEAVADNSNIRGAPKKYKVVALSGLRERNWANTESTIIKVLPYEKEVTIFEVKELKECVWGKTENGYICMAMGDEIFLEEIKDPREVISEDVPTCIPSEAKEEIIRQRLMENEDEAEISKPDEPDEKDEPEESVITKDVSNEDNGLMSDLYVLMDETLNDETEEEITSERFTTDDVYLLAQVMDHEARYEGEDGLTAVAEVVYNRVKSDLFPNTIYEVVYQPGQFAESEDIERVFPKIDTLQIARYILNDGEGVLNNPNILFFRNAGGSTEDWGKYKYELSVNHHQFYSYVR